MSSNGVMGREPVTIPRKPGVYALINSKSARCGYVAFTTDLQKRSHSLAHMLLNPKTHWSIADLPHAPAGEWTFTVIDTDTKPAAASKLIALTRKSLKAKRYRIIEGNRRAEPMVALNGKKMALTEAIAAAKCKQPYITVWRRIDRGWSVEQALDLAEPPVRWNPQHVAERKKRVEKRAAA